MGCLVMTKRQRIYRHTREMLVAGFTLEGAKGLSLHATHPRLAPKPVPAYASALGEDKSTTRTKVGNTPRALVGVSDRRLGY